MTRSIIIFLITTLLSIGTVLAGGVGPPPNPMGIPLDGGISAFLVVAGAYIGYKALKKDEE